jgi:hypothetical protein
MFIDCKVSFRLEISTVLGIAEWYTYPTATRALSLGLKRPGREADHSRPSSAEAKECVEVYLHSPIRHHGVVLS